MRQFQGNIEFGCAGILEMVSKPEEQYFSSGIELMTII